MLVFIIILMVIIVHSITFDEKIVRTDLIVENTTRKITSKNVWKNGLKITRSSDNKYNYSTIFFNDITIMILHY